MFTNSVNISNRAPGNWQERSQAKRRHQLAVKRSLGQAIYLLQKGAGLTHNRRDSIQVGGKV